MEQIRTLFCSFTLCILRSWLFNETNSSKMNKFENYSRLQGRPKILKDDKMFHGSRTLRVLIAIQGESLALKDVWQPYSQTICLDQGSQTRGPHVGRLNYILNTMARGPMQLHRLKAGPAGNCYLDE